MMPISMQNVKLRVCEADGSGWNLLEVFRVAKSMQHSPYCEYLHGRACQLRSSDK